MSAKENKQEVQVVTKEESAAQSAQQEKEQPVTRSAEQVKNQETVSSKSYVVNVKDNPAYCGIGAGGVQFANGQAVIDSERMAAWFREHEGYTVTER